jgi:hypothetical protein
MVTLLSYSPLSMAQVPLPLHCRLLIHAIAITYCAKRQRYRLENNATSPVAAKRLLVTLSRNGGVKCFLRRK